MADSIPGFSPNQFDLVNLPGVGVGIAPHCTCTTSSTTFGPLSCTTHPGKALTFLMRLSPEPQIVPFNTSSDTCDYRTIAGLKNTIRYHILNNSILDDQIHKSQFNPAGTHARPSLDNFDPSTVKVRGYEQIYGDQPGYSKGRVISVEGGRLARNLISNPYQTDTLTVGSNNGVVTLSGCSGKYIKELTLVLDKDSSTNERRSHIIFRYDLGTSSSSCQQGVFKNTQFTSNESIVDNVVMGGSSVSIDVRWTTADFIEIYGYQPKVISATIVYMSQDDFYKHAIYAESFDSSFDAKGRLFVFFEDTINYTELPYTDCPCPPPSSSSSSSSGSLSSTTTGGPTTTGGTGTTTSGGGTGVGGIPGGGGGTFKQGPPAGASSSSSSSSPSSSSSSSSSPPIVGKPPFPILPASPPCFGRDCLGCSGEGIISHNSFTITIGGFTAQALSFKCNGCNGDGFVRILESGVTQVPFCLPSNCDDNDTKAECNWSNTFFVPAIVKNSVVYGCDGYQKVLLPLQINLRQDSNGWTLEAFVTGPDCERYDLFQSSPFALPDPCNFPVQMTNGLTTATLNPEWSTDPCALSLTECVNQYTGTISCVMSPDLGETWYLFRGLVKITHDEKAVRPFISYDPKQDKFHLFWIVRDAIEADLVSEAPIGSSGQMRHITLPAFYFNESDAFIDVLPFPSSSSTATVDLNADSADLDDAISSMGDGGKTLRKMPVSVVVADDVNMVNEFDAAYVDVVGRQIVVRFDRTGTLRDKPAALLPARLAQASCGTMTWTVSGITDQDCGCKNLNGVFQLNFISDPTSPFYGTFVHPEWTLAPSADGNYWVMTNDAGLSNTGTQSGDATGMLTFQKRRLITPCPPTGEYDITCNRCIGTIKATLDAGFELDITFNKADVPNSTDDANVFNIGFQGDVATFTITNPSSDDRNLTGDPIVGLSQNGQYFSVSKNPDTSIPINDSVSFQITVLAPVSGGIVSADVRIDYAPGDNSPYHFRIVANDVNPATVISSSSSSAAGQIFAADAIGMVLFSDDGGTTWQENGEIKVGHYANVTYNSLSDQMFVLYVVDDMLFMRAVRSDIYSPFVDPTQAKYIPINTKAITVDPTLVVPSVDDFSTGSPTIGDALNFPTAFSLPVTTTVGLNIAAESDTASIARPIQNEKDSQGIPTFVVGNKQGDLINAYFPYPASWQFDDKLSVGPTRPAAYITPSGQVRFFYVDINGNLNGGSYRLADPFPDTKVVYKDT